MIRPRLRRSRAICAIALSTALVACHPTEDVPPPSSAGAEPSLVAPSIAPVAAGDPIARTDPVHKATAAPARTRTVINPSAAEIVLLYHSLAGTRPPIERWIERSHRLTGANAPDKGQIRADMRAELESLAIAAASIARLRISLRDAGLSSYDPAYGEFTIAAMAPGSSIPFEEYGQKVDIRLDNAHIAQIWKIEPDRALEVQDKLGPYPRASIDVVLDLVDAVPVPGGGSITARIVEYEIQDARRNGVRIVRNIVPET